jgi:ribosome maturation factor RimP
MTLKELSEKTVLGIIENTNVFLVDIQTTDSKLRKKISVYVDTDDGISIDECSKLSQQIGTELDELIETAYTLEVSSPGADAPLKFTRQYIKNIGRNLKVTKTDNTELKGELTFADENLIIIQPEKKKKTIFEPVSIQYIDIKEAKIMISFK